jgi:hypothetical protein
MQINNAKSRRSLTGARSERGDRSRNIGYGFQISAALERIRGNLFDRLPDHIYVLKGRAACDWPDRDHTLRHPSAKIPLSDLMSGSPVSDLMDSPFGIFPI